MYRYPCSALDERSCIVALRLGPSPADDHSFNMNRRNVFRILLLFSIANLCKGNDAIGKFVKELPLEEENWNYWKINLGGQSEAFDADCGVVCMKNAECKSFLLQNGTCVLGFERNSSALIYGV